MYNQNVELEELINRTLALSNILRGFSFLPGNEKTLVKHIGLLQIIGDLLILLTDEKKDRLFEKKTTKSKEEKEEEIKAELEEDNEMKLKVKTKINVDVSKYFKPRQNLDVKPYVKPEEDSPQRLLLETANHLRDDSFVILAHISVQVNKE